MSGRINVHGMKIRVPPLLIMATLNYWNGPERTNVHGMKRRVPLLLRMVTLKCWNGQGRVNVHGMKRRVPLLLGMAILKCWNGRGRTVVFVIKKYLKMEEGMGTLLWCIIWNIKIVLADRQYEEDNSDFKNYNIYIVSFRWSSLLRDVHSISRHMYHNNSRLDTISFYSWCIITPLLATFSNLSSTLLIITFNLWQMQKPEKASWSKYNLLWSNRPLWSNQSWQQLSNDSRVSLLYPKKYGVCLAAKFMAGMQRSFAISQCNKCLLGVSAFYIA